MSKKICIIGAGSAIFSLNLIKDICVNKKLIGNDTAQRLHKARQICNTDPHEFDARESLNNKNVSFVVWQVQEFLDVAKDDLVYKQE